MNPARELKKIALELEKKSKLKDSLEFDFPIEPLEGKRESWIVSVDLDLDSGEKTFLQAENEESKKVFKDKEEFEKYIRESNIDYLSDFEHIWNWHLIGDGVNE